VQDNELLLLNQARTLDPEALTQIHNSYYAAIYRYLAFRVNDHKTAEDLTSEVFTRFLSALRERSGPKNTLRGYLYGIASMVVKEHYRRQKRSRETELSDQLPSQQEAPEQAVHAQFRREDLGRALENLTDDQQEVVALRFGYEMSIREVAHTMGKSEAAIKMLQARALVALSSWFDRRTVGI
jgi:RNA polymerase sigma-70 factor, ECF subfamily